MALVFQAGALFNSLTVYDNLALYPREHRVANEAGIREQGDARAARSSRSRRPRRNFPSELSGGMKKRVAIARALVMEPQLMLYDEPTSELDPVMSATISEIIATLREEYHVTTIVVSHDRDLALDIADRVGILMDGKLLFLGPPAELHQPKDNDLEAVVDQCDQRGADCDRDRLRHAEEHICGGRHAPLHWPGLRTWNAVASATTAQTIPSPETTVELRTTGVRATSQRRRRGRRARCRCRRAGGRRRVA